jgi:hypothetical protein
MGDAMVKIFVVLAAVSLSLSAFGQRLNETDIYPGFRISVAVPEGIAKTSEISDQIELALRKSSIAIQSDSPEGIQFKAHGKMSPDGTMYAISVRLDLMRPAISLGSLVRCAAEAEKDKAACQQASARYVSAWNQEDVVVAGKENISEAVKDTARKFVDSFILFYLRETQGSPGVKAPQ